MADENHMAQDVLDEILEFWFGECREQMAALVPRVGVWFGGSRELDREITRRWSALPDAAAHGELDSWRETPASIVALVLILDQFPRNLHRGSPLAFAYDAKALEVTLEALDRGVDEQLTPVEACFLYLPLEHAEDRTLQHRCVDLFEGLTRRCQAEAQPTFQNFANYAARHRDVIDRFGRFPHRNDVVGRETTAAERAYLSSGGETFS